MAERVTMWKSKNGRFFENQHEAETEDRSQAMFEAMFDVLAGMPDEVASGSLEGIARHLAEQGYQITNTHPEHASA